MEHYRGLQMCQAHVQLTTNRPCQKQVSQTAENNTQRSRVVVVVLCSSLLHAYQSLWYFSLFGMKLHTCCPSCWVSLYISSSAYKKIKLENGAVNKFVTKTLMSMLHCWLLSCASAVYLSLI